MSSAASEPMTSAQRAIWAIVCLAIVLICLELILRAIIARATSFRFKMVHRDGQLVTTGKVLEGLSNRCPVQTGEGCCSLGSRSARFADC